jgi:hypothetical protein
MQVAGIKKDIEQLKKAAKSEKNIDLTTEEWGERINKERAAEGKHPVIYINFNHQTQLIGEIFYEFNLEKIDEYRIQDGKFPLLPLYLAGEYKKVENELIKHDFAFFNKIPKSTLLEDSLQPLADMFGFDHIDYYNDTERLFMQDQKLYNLHHKPELGDEFRKYLISEWEKEGAVLEFDKEKQTIIRLPAEKKQIEEKMIVSDRARQIIKPVVDVSGEYRFIETVKIMNCFEFEDSVAVPGQIITLKYTPTGEYKGVWSAEYSNNGNVLPISNIKLWVWVHQRDINRKIHEIVKEHGENEPTAIKEGSKRD